MIQNDIRRLVGYGVQTGLVPMEDVIYTTNRLLELFELEEMDVSEEVEEAAADDQAAGTVAADGRAAGMASADGQAAGTVAADGLAAGTVAADDQAAGTVSADGQTTEAEAADVHAAEMAQAGVLEKILGRMCDYACEHGLIAEDSVVYRDLFDTKESSSVNGIINGTPPF